MRWRPILPSSTRQGVLLSVLACVSPRSGPVRLATPSQPPDFRIVQPSGGSRELLTFERMLKVKPYPARCPYDGIELFGAAEPLRLQPPPPRTVGLAIKRFYRQVLGWRPRRVLEHTCDGMSRLPGLGSQRGSVQLHASDGSYAVANEAASHMQHLRLSAAQRVTAAAGLQYEIPHAEGSFDAVVSHNCVPYAVAPLPLFTELHRLVRPGGTLAVTFAATPSSVEQWSQYANCDPRSASLAWLQAADGADLLYMVCSFFFYSAEWASLEVSELLPASPSSPAPVYAIVATKLTNRQLFVRKSRRTIAQERLERERERERESDTDGEAEWLGGGEQSTLAAVSPSRAAGTGTKSPRPRTDGRAGTLADSFRRAGEASTSSTSASGVRESNAGVGGSTRGDRDAARTPGTAPQRSSRLAQPTVPLMPSGTGGDGVRGVRESDGLSEGEADERGARVRSRILETIKRGIQENRERTDLADGERRMLEHMRLYVVETKMAETQLSAQELAIWEDMKQEYLERTRATATSARVPATAPAPSPAPLDANPETDAADGPPPPSQGI